jgi:hypothetical protein
MISIIKNKQCSSYDDNHMLDSSIDPPNTVRLLPFALLF